MAQNTDNRFSYRLLFFDTLDSTNNYAIKSINDGMARNGMTIWTSRQTQGKGQRGKRWESPPDKNIAMSVILNPNPNVPNQWALSALVAQVTATYISRLLLSDKIFVKWPNDIYINDKKTSGILIENIFRGMTWEYAVVGIGINVNQTYFDQTLSKATSLYLSSGNIFDKEKIVVDIRNGILNAMLHFDFEQTMLTYNQLLYKKNQIVVFTDKLNRKIFKALVKEVSKEGQLILETENGIRQCDFGSVEWHI